MAKINTTAGLFLTERDHELFYFLYRVKSAALSQVNRSIYRYKNCSALHKRVSLLERNGLVGTVTFTKGKREKVIHLTRRAFERSIDDVPRPGVKLRSDSVEHDLALVDLLYYVEQARNVGGYLTENELVGDQESFEDRLLQSIVECHSDAAVEIIFPDDRMHVPLEYEASFKSPQRIRETIGKYYSCSHIPVVLYVCKTESLITKFMREETECFSDHDPKLFYAKFDDLVEGPSIVCEPAYRRAR